MRNDLVRRWPPRHLQRLLTERYGRTDGGEPYFRLVWAPARLERSGGLWTDWQGGPRGGLRRRVAEIRWVPKYPGEVCWLIEQWVPPLAYGTPALWAKPVTEGGTMLPTAWGPVATLGPYPDRGDYEDIGARMYWYPSERHLTLAVDKVRHARASLPSNPRQRVREALRRAERLEAVREREFEAFCHDVLEDANPAFSGAPMTGHGSKRRPSLVSLAEGMGIRVHPY